MSRPRIYVERGPEQTEALVASTFPVSPPDEWLRDPELTEPTPITVTADGRVFGHIAAWKTDHIGLPGNVKPPRSASGYKYFTTGLLRTASGADVPVGQLTLAGGHAPLSADASAAVKHYDDTASAIADVAAGEDRHGIWIAGGVRPDATPSQIRSLRASAPSGDWRPINGNLELVACCQVNVPGFPLGRARTASGAVVALVAAGARDMAVRRVVKESGLSGEDLSARVAELESVVASLQVENRRAALRSSVHRK